MSFLSQEPELYIKGSPIKLNILGGEIIQQRIQLSIYFYQ